VDDKELITFLFFLLMCSLIVTVTKP